MVTKAQIDITARDKTKRAFQSINSGLKGMSSGVARVLTGLAPLIGVAGFAALTSQSLKSVDALAKTADKLNVTTESLASLQHLTDLYTNASAPAMSEALTKATKRLGEFNATGGGAASVWLKKLNLDTAELATLKPDELFKRYSKEIGELNDRGQQLAAVSALMGDESRALIGIIDAGVDVFDEAAETVDKFGTGVSRLDASRIEDANDSITLMQEAIHGLGIEIAVELAPRITQFLNWMLDIEESISSLSEVQVLNRLTDVSDQLEKIEGQIGKGRHRGPVGKKANELHEKRLELLLKEAEFQERLNDINSRNNERGEAAPDSTDSEARLQQGQEKQAERVKIEEELDRQRLADKFFRLDENLLSEQERLRLGLEEREFIVEEAFQASIITDLERKNQLQAVEQQHQAQLSKIISRGLTEREKFERKSTLDKVKTQLSLMTQMTQGLASSSKSMFNINKTLALANAAVSLPDAVLQSFRNAGGYPWGVAPAALMAATGAAQIRAISSSSFGGGGASAPSIAGSGIDSVVGTVPLSQPSTSAETNAAPDAPDAAIAAQQTLTLSIGDEDRMLSVGAMRNFIEEFLDVAADMGPNTKIVLS